jgi:hypothetical protein
MKTAISCSRRLKVSRGRLFAAAAREYLARHSAVGDATESWNRAIAKGGQPGDDPAAVALRRRSLTAIRSSLAKRR